MRIREARVEDAGPIAEIHVRAWQEGYRDLMPAPFLASLSATQREPLWRKRLAEGGGPTVLVAEQGAEIGGWAVCGASRDADAASRSGELHALNVFPPVWRSGFGKALGRAALERLAAARFSEATLWVLDGNERARRLYEALGFQPEPGSRRDYHGDGFAVPELRYRRVL
jgi:ribosomal protein S18 acetylase RimI-like enzyme